MKLMTQHKWKIDQLGMAFHVTLEVTNSLIDRLKTSLIRNCCVFMVRINTSYQLKSLLSHLSNLSSCNFYNKYKPAP